MYLKKKKRTSLKRKGNLANIRYPSAVTAAANIYTAGKAKYIAQRRRFDVIERLFVCGHHGSTKSYGTYKQQGQSRPINILLLMLLVRE